MVQSSNGTLAVVVYTTNHRHSVDALARCLTKPRPTHDAAHQLVNVDESVPDLVKQLEQWLCSSKHLAIPVHLVHCPPV